MRRIVFINNYSIKYFSIIILNFKKKINKFCNRYWHVTYETFIRKKRSASEL